MPNYILISTVKKEINRNLPNDLFKPKHSVRELFVRSFGTHFRIVWIGVIFIKKLHDVKAATIDIKMNVSLLEIRRDRFPHFYFRV